MPTIFFAVAGLIFSTTSQRTNQTALELSYLRNSILGDNISSYKTRHIYFIKPLIDKTCWCV